MGRREASEQVGRVYQDLLMWPFSPRNLQKERKGYFNPKVLLHPENGGDPLNCWTC